MCSSVWNACTTKASLLNVSATVGALDVLAAQPYEFASAFVDVRIGTQSASFSCFLLLTRISSQISLNAFYLLPSVSSAKVSMDARKSIKDF